MSATVAVIGGQRILCRTDWCRHCGGADYRHNGLGPQEPRPIPLSDSTGVHLFLLPCPGFEPLTNEDNSWDIFNGLKTIPMTTEEVRAWHDAGKPL